MERRAGHPAMLTIALGFGNGSSVWFLGLAAQIAHIGALASFIMIVLAGASEGRRSGSPRGETE